MEFQELRAYIYALGYSVCLEGFFIACAELAEGVCRVCTIFLQLCI